MASGSQRCSSQTHRGWKTFLARKWRQNGGWAGKTQVFGVTRNWIICIYNCIIRYISGYTYRLLLTPLNDQWTFDRSWELVARETLQKLQSMHKVRMVKKYKDSRGVQRVVRTQVLDSWTVPCWLIWYDAIFTSGRGSRFAEKPSLPVAVLFHCNSHLKPIHWGCFEKSIQKVLLCYSCTQVHIDIYTPNCIVFRYRYTVLASWACLS